MTAQAEITRTDQERRIASRTTDLVASLARAASAVERRAEAAQAQRETYEATRDLLAAGEVNLTDTILSEEQLLFAQLELVAAREVYALVLADLLFETATLLEVSGEEQGWSLERFRTSARDL